MAVKASNKITPSWYTANGQDDSTDKTRFLIKPLTGAQYLECIEVLHTISQAQGQLRVLRYGLVDWEKFSDDAGIVEFDRQNMSENIGRLPWQLISEITDHILKISDVGSAERKN